MADYILDKVLHYGAFKENLDKVVDIMRSECASSLIIRGNPGSGKRTLIEEAQKVTKVRLVYISPHFYSDDYMAMKAIAKQLGFKARGAHIADLMMEIKESARDQEKLVIVLLDFEEFCRKRQALLYNLMNLIHTNPTLADKSVNLTLVGFTACLDWAENIEKRVRSRLDAKCINVTNPYRNAKEFREFTSELLGGYKIDDGFEEQLDYIYDMCTPNPTPRTLKKYLNNIIDCDEKGNLTVNFDPLSLPDDYQINLNNLLREQLRYLTRLQLNLLKFAVSYCFVNQKSGFSLHELSLYLDKREYKGFVANSQLTLWDLSLLLRLKLIKPAKHDQPISTESTFYPAVVPRQFRAVINGDHELQFSQTDAFWRTLK